MPSIELLLTLDDGNDIDNDGDGDNLPQSLALFMSFISLSFVVCRLTVLCGWIFAPARVEIQKSKRKLAEIFYLWIKL